MQRAELNQRICINLHKIINIFAAFAHSVGAKLKSPAPPRGVSRACREPREGAGTVALQVRRLKLHCRARWRDRS